ncbi:sulfurtransferase FdhD [Rhodobacteraceae bacterium RKSG542]|uniref:formate dehydrogenase accessory sulfurtransferase FdhD n=1 Tax=Pseudovibrio flavus TaxID=2529854 RepID=UPI0012BC09C7|nr:formate dehydrogenase accessory sulfurtransferase FdhD [Pseudovibrio flavus]MTI18624.1 sulfurtransferase FdhD [Pseudovibrio flavus]
MVQVPEQDFAESVAPSELPPEAAVAITLNGEGFAVLMATPQDLEDLAVGYAVSEGIVPHFTAISAIKQVEHGELGYSVDLSISDDHFFTALKRRRAQTATAGCGLCGVDSLAAAMRPLPQLTTSPLPSPLHIEAAGSELEAGQTLSKRYGGGLHCALVKALNGDIYLREDIGRHNALDKALGAALRAQCTIEFAMTTSRCSADLVQKVAVTGVGALVVMAMPSDLSVKLAKQSGVNLISTHRGRTLVYYNKINA